ncbi:glutathione S-transferase [Rhodobacter sp. JA431]|uniref:glutathione S-transferase family protein n=1 Tax=Rhodobacter sp. JA431 TaxID=570013 RepID=UPI000BD6504D|nr:glutathione S-transferase family protein [Rhodobacter sp. JA431]SOC14030.1 glutathione S-transferase [Rhodobacter sp. JA431]
MLVLHYAPDNASLIVRLALEEAGLGYTTALVDRSTHAQQSAAYRALNPAGRIPVLVTPEGPLAETGAILLWLSEQAPQLAPAVPRGLFLQWLFFLSNTAHPEMRALFYPHLYADEAGRATHLAHTRTRFTAALRLIEAACAERPALFAPPSVLGAYVAAFLRWSVLYARPEGWFALADYPALAAMARDWEGRNSVAALCRAEGMAPAPFTAPAPPDPPEGVAL